MGENIRDVGPLGTGDQEDLLKGGGSCWSFRSGRINEVSRRSRGEGQHGVGRKKRGGVSSENSQRAERMKTCSWQPTIDKKTVTGLSSFPSPKNRSR